LDNGSEFEDEFEFEDDEVAVCGEGYLGYQGLPLLGSCQVVPLDDHKLDQVLKGITRKETWS